MLLLGKVPKHPAADPRAYGGQITSSIKPWMLMVLQTIREAGGVCIADEVQTGFGRTGSHFWGFETQVSALLPAALLGSHMSLPPASGNV